jgi:hypothetical protein
MDLRDTVDGSRSLDGEVRTGVPGSGGAKRSDGAGAEETKVMCFTHFNDVLETSDVHLQVRMRGGEEG